MGYEVQESVGEGSQAEAKALVTKRRRWNMPEQPTIEKLALALEEAGAPEYMIKNARQGLYDDYKSPLIFPEQQLFADARKHGLTRILDGVLNGEWDATKTESDAWAASPDGQETFRQFGL